MGHVSTTWRMSVDCSCATYLLKGYVYWLPRKYNAESQRCAIAERQPYAKMKGLLLAPKCCSLPDKMQCRICCTHVKKSTPTLSLKLAHCSFIEQTPLQCKTTPNLTVPAYIRIDLVYPWIGKPPTTTRMISS